MLDLSKLDAALNEPGKPAAAVTGEPDPMLSIVGLDAPTEAQMLFYYDNPTARPKGETTHSPELDKIFKWVPGWMNLVTAYPNVGKSQHRREMLLARAAFDKAKSCCWVPEDMPREAFYDALIHTLSGQNPDTAKEHALPRLYYQRCMEFVREYFYVIQPIKGQGRTPGHVLDLFETARAKLNCQHFLTDPWHKLDHSGQVAAGGIKAYLDRELANFTDWCNEQQVYLDVIINPRSILRPSGEAFPVPDVDNLSGGATWSDFGATIAAYDRPQRHVNRSAADFSIYTHKIKNYNRADARPGSYGAGSENPDILIEFDWKSARYFTNGHNPLAHPIVQAIYAPELAGQPIAGYTPDPVPGFAPLPASTFEEEAPAKPNHSGLGNPGIKFGLDIPWST